MSPENIQNLFNLLVEKKELRSIFIEAKGIEKCLNQLLKAEISRKEGLLIAICLNGEGPAEKRVLDYGIPKLHSHIISIL